MADISSSILIDRPIQEVFDFVVNPLNAPKIHPYIKENADINPANPCLGQTFNWRYSMKGIEMKGIAKVTEYLPPLKYVMSTTGDVISTWSYLFEDTNGRVKVTLSIAYAIDKNFIKRIVNLVILDRFNQEILVDALENLKAQLESELNTPSV